MHTHTNERRAWDAGAAAATRLVTDGARHLKSELTRLKRYRDVKLVNEWADGFLNTALDAGVSAEEVFLAGVATGIARARLGGA